MAAVATTGRKVCRIEGCVAEAAPRRAICYLHQGRKERLGDPLAVGPQPRGRVDLPPEPPDPRPIRALRLQLQHDRAQGRQFVWAWSHATELALAQLPPGLRAEWQRALADTREAWRSAYERLPVPRQPLAVLLVHVQDSDFHVHRLAGRTARNASVSDRNGSSRPPQAERGSVVA